MSSKIKIGILYAIMIIACVAMCIDMKAENFRSVHILHTDGQESVISVSESLEISFADREIYFTSHDTTLNFSIDNVKSFSYSHDEIQGENDPVLTPELVISDGLIKVDATAPCIMSDIGGRVIRIDSEAGCIDISRMPPGVYILSVGNRSIKIRL